MPDIGGGQHNDYPVILKHPTAVLSTDHLKTFSHGAAKTIPIPSSVHK